MGETYVDMYQNNHGHWVVVELLGQRQKLMYRVLFDILTEIIPRSQVTSVESSPVPPFQCILTGEISFKKFFPFLYSSRNLVENKCIVFLSFLSVKS